MTPSEATVVVVGGAVAGAGATFLVRRIALALGMVNAPNPIVPQHRRPVAYLGGVGVASGAALAWAVASSMLETAGSGARSIVPGALGFLLLGLVDDIRPLTPLGKLVAQVLITGIALFSGCVAEVSGVPILDIAVSGLWILTVVNAANLTDVCDGLLTGLAAIGLTAIAWQVPELRVAALASAGACLGFLVWNAPPATIFLGDAGSHLLGFLLAAGGIGRFADEPALASAADAVGYTAVPLFEMALLITVRRRKGIPIWRGSPDHFSLRLQALGWSRWRTDALAWSCAIAACAGIWVSAQAREGAAPIALLALVLAGVGAGHVLVAREVPRA